MSETLNFDLEVKTIDGSKLSLNTFKNKVLLIVNTASECGFTPQYGELQKLHDQYGGENFEILAFPCNQFGGQEPLESDDIKKFCDLNYRVKFPLFAKIDVNGDKQHPLYKQLSSAKRGLLGTTKIKWNFTKFLVDQDGVILKRYSPQYSPLKIASDIENLLNNKP